MESLRRPGLAKLIWFDMVQFVLCWFSLGCLGQFGLVCIIKKVSNLDKLKCYGLVWVSLVWFGLVWFSLV